MSKKRLYGAAVCYGAIALAASLVLDDPFRLAVCILLAVVAAKSWIAYLRER